jgi:hypothetical protein
VQEEGEEAASLRSGIHPISRIRPRTAALKKCKKKKTAAAKKKCKKKAIKLPV